MLSVLSLARRCEPQKVQVTTANLVKSKAAKHENKRLTYARRSSSEKLY